MDLRKGLPPEPPLQRLMRGIVTLPRSTKRLIMMLADAVAMPLCLAVALWVVAPRELSSIPAWIWAVPPLCGALGHGLWGLYQSVGRRKGFELVAAASKTATSIALPRLPAVSVVDTVEPGLGA